MILKVGDKAPDFKLLTDEGQRFSLESLKGKKVILYFYPKDMTPGCTQEACDFRDTFADFTEKNAIVLGISKDSVDKHRKFKEKYSLPFTLLADTDGKVCEVYGVINPKSMWGKTFLGIERCTFLIDKDGTIESIWRKVKVKDHIQQVKEELSKQN